MLAYIQSLKIQNVINKQTSMQFLCYRQIDHLILSEIKSFNCPQSLPSIISFNNFILFLPCVALPNYFPSSMSWRKLSYPRPCPSHLCFLCQIGFNMLLHFWHVPTPLLLPVYICILTVTFLSVLHFILVVGTLMFFSLTEP